MGAGGRISLLLGDGSGISFLFGDGGRISFHFGEVGRIPFLFGAPLKKSPCTVPSIQWSLCTCGSDAGPRSLNSRKIVNRLRFTMSFSLFSPSGYPTWK
jgi:hypothetical protein